MQTHVTFSPDDVRAILSGVAGQRTGQRFNVATPHADGSITLSWEPAHEADTTRRSWWRWTWRDSVVEHKSFEARLAALTESPQ